MKRLRHWGFSLGTRLFAAVLLTVASTRTQAAIAVLVGESFGRFGFMMPVGHAAIYLDHVCADGPLKLRACVPGEQEGVVIARYHRIGHLDWLATPVMEFLYATDSPGKVLPYATLYNSWDLREIYRKRYLEAIVPDGTEYEKFTGEWWESAGAAYTRRLWCYQLDTTAEQDRRFIAFMNERSNVRAYKVNKRNCADFAANLVNLYYPGAVKRDHLADFGWMTPKNVARSVDVYGRTHPELNLRVFEVPQVPGSLPRSKHVWGAAESGLKTKTYLFTLLAIQPEVPLVCEILYLKDGRWKIGQGAEIERPQDFSLAEPQTLATR